MFASRAVGEVKLVPFFFFNHELIVTFVLKNSIFSKRKQ